MKEWAKQQRRKWRVLHNGEIGDFYIYFQKYRYEFVMRGTLSATRDFFFSADAGVFRGAQVDGKSQAIRSFGEFPVVVEIKLHNS
jgi:hypothetical protein